VTFRKLITYLTFLAVFTMAVRVSVDSDTWWHLKAGEWILENREILRMDPFSITRIGESWVYPGWISQLLLFAVFQFSGFAGLNLLTGFLVVLAFGVVWKKLEAPPLFRSLIVILAAAASGVYWSARPQIFSFALAGVFLAILEGETPRSPRKLILLPVVMAVWANIHGGFVIGFLILLAYLGGEIVESVLGGWLRGSVADSLRQRKQAWLHLIWAGLGCVAAVCLNPHGPIMLLYPFQTVSIGALQNYIQEWQSPNFHQLEILPFLILILALLAAFSWTSRRVRAVEFLLVIGFLPLALMAGRNIALFALAATIPLARHGYDALKPLLDKLPPSKPLPERITRPLNLSLILLLSVAALAKISIPLQPAVIETAIQTANPVGAADYLEAHPGLGRLFNSYNWGGYVIWRLYPQYLSFVDGRTDLFDDVILDDYLQAWRAEEGWEQIMLDWDIDVALIESGAPLAGALEDAGWEAAYEDSMAVILLRTEP